MRWMHDLSIRWKLVLATGLTSAFALLFSGAIMAWYDGQVYKTEKMREISVVAGIVGSAVAPSLDFGDSKAAQEYLDALKANPEIVSAGIYGGDGTPLASYSSAAADPIRLLPDKAPPAGARFEEND